MTRQEYKDIYEVIGAAMEVHNALGRGLAEPIYQEALSKEMNRRGIRAEREKELRMFYKGELLDKIYYADFFYKGIIIELKAVEEITSEHRAQLFNYMRITKSEKGVLINFGERSLRAERYLYIEEDDDFVLLTQDNFKDYIDL